MKQVDPRASDVVLCMVSDTFADSKRRGFYSTADQMILSLIASDAIRRVMVVDHPRGITSQVSRRLARDLPAPRSGKLRGLRPWTLRTGLPDDRGAVGRRYRSFDAQISLAVRRYSLLNPTLITFDVLHAAFGNASWASRSVFYAQDDETEIPRLAYRRELSAEAYARVDAGPATVAAVSTELLGRIAPSRAADRRLVIANGVDPALWQNLPGPPTAHQAERPVAVYAGTVDARLDISAFAQLAADGFLVDIIGPVRDDAARSALASIEGLNLRGSFSREQVAAALAAADVCILAHLATPLTQAMSPLKLFEYLASGTPVVATDLSGTREGIPPTARVQFAEPGGDYAAAARQALIAGRMAEPDRRRLVETVSWRRRHAPLIAACGA